MNSEELFIKVMMIGDSSVGKSSILHLYKNGEKCVSLSPTYGLDVVTKNENIEGKEVQLIIYDTAGQEKFRSMAKTNFRTAKGFVLVYSIDNKTSFSDVKRWVDDVIEYNENPNIILIGNKNDLVKKREVSFEEGKEMADLIGCPFHELNIHDYGISSFSNIEAVFRELTQIIVKKSDLTERSNQNGLDLKESSKPRRKCAPC